ncbi:polysaccharide deacetylase family protein [Anaerobranca gottschalkii]|uniref:Polysaccharide deacetylase n=1 Tax=Anaerobranca gottschalkii DSM 13577 TaxID=1120990 RepID=A0A1I0BLW2_9FIRM|nr:polysaccharide deacetylase family protein [Anaerobranca gottschalkii]SET07279.1 Polysaccharide deacetylase [Anaerobranca gottschalkii DSM 13577]
MFKKIFIVIFSVFILLSACTTTPSNTKGVNDDGIPQDQVDKETDTENEEELIDEEIDFQKIRPNELGRIMVLMYHQIGPEEREWIRTPDNFRRDLQTLYDNGYRLVSLRDVLRGEISVPAGYSPVVITFDDGTEGQFRYIEKDGEWVIDPDSAVGILLEMNEKNPGLGTAATFFVNSNPFRQPEHTKRKLEELVRFGMDIGNHTLTHPNLSTITSPEEMQRQMGGLVKEIQSYLPDYQIDTLALPFGAHPKEELYPYAIKGQYEGTEYHHKGILLVGSHPSHSPFHKDFNPLRIPRIRGEDPFEYGYLYYWLDYFERNPHLRYISDGDPRYVTFPEKLLDEVDLSNFPEKKIRTY